MMPQPAAPALRRPAPRRAALTLIELLVVVGIIALLIAILMPSLRTGREQALAVRCGSNLRQLGLAFHMYSTDFEGNALPLAYTDTFPPRYWWGSETGSGIEHEAGFTFSYLGADLETRGVYDCPIQAKGTYVAQGPSGEVSSTYGYNGYYLTPAATPGWAAQIKHRPWQRIDLVQQPSLLFVFADTMIDLGGTLKNNALLDPPWLYRNRRWRPNESPTTIFRHSGLTQAVHVDGSVARYRPTATTLVSEEFQLGSVGEFNDPHYVPDWREW